MAEATMGPRQCVAQDRPAFMSHAGLAGWGTPRLLFNLELLLDLFDPGEGWWMGKSTRSSNFCKYMCLKL